MATLNRVRTYDASVTQQRAIPLTKLASWLLVAAFTISSAYQLYRSTVMEVPAHDRFDLSIAVIYGVFFSIAVLVGTGRRWAPWLGLVASVGWTLVGILYYYPVITPVRTFGPIDWTEAVVYLGLIFTAGVLCVCDLCGVALTVGRLPEQIRPAQDTR